MDFWYILVIIFCAFIFQYILSFKQLGDFSRNFAQVKRQGKVIIGRKRGGFFAGAIVMIAFGDDEIIKDIRCLSGVSFLAKFKKIDDFNGFNINDIEKSPKYNTYAKQIRLALINSIDNLNKHKLGEEIPIPDPPLKALFKRVFRKWLFI